MRYLTDDEIHRWVRLKIAERKREWKRRQRAERRRSIKEWKRLCAETISGRKRQPSNTQIY